MLRPDTVLAWLGDLVHSLNVPKPDEDPTGWRRAMRATVVLIGALLLLHFTWAWGFLGRAGYAGPVDSEQFEELREEIDDKVEAAIAPLQEKADSTDRMTRALLRNAFREEIAAKVRERCDTNDARERARINDELGRIKREYLTLAGEPWGREPRCDEV